MAAATKKGRCESGLAKFLRELRQSGDIVLVDSALLALAQSLAIACDDHADNAALFREYRAVLEQIREAAAGGVDDDTTTFRLTVQAPRGRASMGNAED